MKTKTTSKFAMLFLMLFSFNALASDGVINDLPKTILSCQETKDGALVLDGDKKLILSQDQFGQSYLTVIQKDQFSGNSTLLENLPVIERTNNGCESCDAYQTADGSTQFFVNHFGSVNDALLVSVTVGSVEFVCKNK